MPYFVLHIILGNESGGYRKGVSMEISMAQAQSKRDRQMNKTSQYNEFREEE